MKLALLRLIALCLLVLAPAGCGSPSQPEQSSVADRYQICEAALRYVMDKHSNSGNESGFYSAYIIKGGEFAAQLPASFPDYKPPVATNIQVSTVDGEAVDKANGKPVKIWAVSIGKIQGNHATASVSWYSARMASGVHTVNLHKEDGRWIAESERMDIIS